MSNRTSAKRFWDKVDRSSDCWEWQATRSAGYGSFYFKGDKVKAHRWVYARYIADIPKGKFVMHKCDNKLCVNPRHLEVGTCKQNTRDAVARGLIPTGNRHYRVKLRDEDISTVVAKYHAGYSGREIGEMFGVTASCIYNVVCSGRRL